MRLSAPTDGRGRSLTTPSPPQRILSLVPSTTETLFDLGCGDRVVGCTRFCVRPAEQVAELPKVGGTKDVDPERVSALRPDLILANCEENTREIFEALDSVAPLWAPLPRTVDEALSDLLHTGELIHATAQAQDWHRRIQTARADLRAATPGHRFSYAYLIWRSPFMTVSDDTFIASMLAETGGLNVFGEHPDRFPTTSATEIASLQPDLVLLSSEPFPFRDRHRQELHRATGLPLERLRYIDGELASWHGTRMLRAFASFAQSALHGFPTDPIRAPG